ncbi:hypothetical protein [Alkalibacillus silvisoli]|uniref:3-oxoacyl-ACP synthase n=1 Tax=Alkalibacillus silvisoli TaxID=392823 RepID=A0ABP3JM86_9BACI
MNNVRIRSVEVYHPEQQVTVEELSSHFKKKGKDVTHFLTDILGRNDKYVINRNEENSLTMGIEVSKKIIQKEKITGKDIDMVIFASQTPEQLFPSNALYIHQTIGGHHKSLSMDMNANCAGMLVAIEHASVFRNPKLTQIAT